MDTSTDTMQHKEDGNAKGSCVSLLRWQAFLAKTTLAFAAACSGVVLYEALFPSFYYMAWIACLIMLWGLVALAYLLQMLVLLAVARWKHVALPSSPQSGPGFIAGLLLLVTLLVAFKMPLHASFLLAKPDLEQALAEHADDLDDIGRLAKYYNCGIYPIHKAHRRCHKKDRIYFQFRNDSESAIIYSESGIDDLCYNSGNKGHLSGNWYWMTED